MSKHYIPVAPRGTNLDTMFLIHESMHLYIQVPQPYPGKERSGFAIRLSLLGQPTMVIINGNTFFVPSPPLPHCQARFGGGWVPLPLF